MNLLNHPISCIHAVVSHKWVRGAKRIQPSISSIGGNGELFDGLLQVHAGLGQQPPDCTYMDGKPACMSRAEMLLHVINHGSYHRGAVGELLHQCGLPAPHDVLSRFLN